MGEVADRRGGEGDTGKGDVSSSLYAAELIYVSQTLADCGLRCALPSDDVTAVPNPGDNGWQLVIQWTYFTKAFLGGICGSTGTLPAE
ncbi:hypothetical protein VTO73DRAFT_6444 [Trametes versicolor]